MLDDISLGRYVPGVSTVHALDPRTKTIATLAIAVGMVQGVSLTGTALHLVMVVTTVALGRIPWVFVLRSLRPFAWLLLIVLTSHIMMRGYGNWQPGVALAGRLLGMLTLASLLSWTTQPLSIVAGLSSMGRPLARLGFPVDASAVALGLALRFAPVALDEARNIMRAQAARGADFSGIGRKLALVAPMLGTLFERAFERADTLSEAMEARGFMPGGRRSQYRRLGFHAPDALAFAITTIWIGMGILIEQWIG
jgi:energy-coupling factor transport system permease protein